MVSLILLVPFSEDPRFPTATSHFFVGEGHHATHADLGRLFMLEEDEDGGGLKGIIKRGGRKEDTEKRTMKS